MENNIKQIIEESCCTEEVWVRVEEEYGDEGINYLFSIGYPMN